MLVVHTANRDIHTLSASIAAPLNNTTLPITQAFNNSKNSITTNNQPNSPLAKLRPEDGHVLILPNSHISLIFDKYGQNLLRDPVFTTLFQARFIAGEGVAIFGPLAKAEYLRPFKGVGLVTLEVEPSDRLTWYDLFAAIEGLMDFVSTFGAFEFEFEIRSRGGSPLGKGRLSRSS